jgi:hypothetical protein
MDPLTNTKPIDYGKRLLPVVLDEMALSDPTHVLRMALTSSESQSFTSLTAAQLANAVNYMAHILDVLVSKASTIAFVRLQDFHTGLWSLRLLRQEG